MGAQGQLSGAIADFLKAKLLRTGHVAALELDHSPHMAPEWCRCLLQVLYTKLPADVEERTVTLQASEGTIRSVLDTLTSCCMQ